MNGHPSLDGAHNGTVPSFKAVSPYVKCVIDATGLGALGGLFTGAFLTLIEKKLWKEAAMYIIKLVGKNVIKGAWLELLLL